MDFFLIMGIGTAVAIWVVVNLRQSRNLRGDIISYEQKPHQTPASSKDMSEYFSTDGFDYLRKLDRHLSDPHHWPCPFPPPEPRQERPECD